MDLSKTGKTMNKMLLEREEMLEKMAQEPEKKIWDTQRNQREKKTPKKK